MKLLVEILKIQEVKALLTMLIVNMIQTLNFKIFNLYKNSLKDMIDFKEGKLQNPGVIVENIIEIYNQLDADTYAKLMTGFIETLEKWLEYNHEKAEEILDKVIEVLKREDIQDDLVLWISKIAEVQFKSFDSFSSLDIDLENLKLKFQEVKKIYEQKFSKMTNTFNDDFEDTFPTGIDDDLIEHKDQFKKIKETWD